MRTHHWLVNKIEVQDLFPINPGRVHLYTPLVPAHASARGKVRCMPARAEPTTYSGFRLRTAIRRLARGCQGCLSGQNVSLWSNFLSRENTNMDPNDEDLTAGAAGEEDEIVIHAGMSSWQKFAAFFGPGLLIATVYIDPGQIVVDMETGSAFQYRMLWAMLAANGMGLMFQHLCSRLAIVTGRNLAVECRLEYPRGMRIFLWLTVELASIAADLGYVMGTATALTILTGMDLHWGVLLTGLDTFLALGLQSLGIRKIEALIGSLFGLVVCCYFVELLMVRPSVLGVMDGLLPRLWHKNAKYGYGDWLNLLCANLGAAVCPPNFFLHSALVRTRKITNRSMGTIVEAFEYNLYETGICLGLATLVNAVMLILAAAHFFPERVVSLAQGADLLKEVLGSSSRVAFAIAMLCAGQSSSLTGVLSTQYIMEGFFEMSVPAWVVRITTRALAIIPAFYVVYSRGPDVAAELIEQAQVVVNFVVPFTVIPLTKFLSSPAKMGPYRLSKGTEHACWAASAVAIVLNLMAIQQAIEGLDVTHDGIKIGCSVVVIGAYLYFSWWFFSRPVQVGTPGLGAGVPGWGEHTETFVAAQGSKLEATAGISSGGASDSSRDHGGGIETHNFTGEELTCAWSSSPGIGFFLGGIGSAGVLPGGGVAAKAGGAKGNLSRWVTLGVAAAVVLAACVQSYREAGDWRCLLDHVGVIVGDGCDIPALRGRVVA